MHAVTGYGQPVPTVSTVAFAPAHPATVAAAYPTAPVIPGAAYVPEQWDPTGHWSAGDVGFWPEQIPAARSDLMIRQSYVQQHMARRQRRMPRRRQGARIPWLPLILGGAGLWFLFGRKK